MQMNFLDPLPFREVRDTNNKDLVHANYEQYDLDITVEVHPLPEVNLTQHTGGVPCSHGCQSKGCSHACNNKVY